MQWSDWVTALAAELAMTGTIVNPALPAPSNVPDFNNILPRCVEFTELTMLRDADLDFLAVRTFDATTMCSASSRNVALPTQIIVPLELNVITPVGTAPDSGTRNPVQRVSVEFISMMFPTVAPATAPSIPLYYALTDNNQQTTNALQARFGPAPDAAYVCEWYGQYRPAALSATNTSNYLSTLVPDLYLAASMIFMSGYQRNFGAQADDPKMALSWRAVYDDLKKGAVIEQARLKAQGPGWSGYAPTPAATPPRM